MTFQPAPREVGLQLLHDLAVATDRAVEALQVAVDDEDEIVELFARGDADGTQSLRLVHLAVAEERPHPAATGVANLTVQQVAVESSLVNRVDRSEPHGDGGELPEIRHQAGVGVGRQAAGADLLPEAVELALVQPALEVSPGVDAGGGVTLKEDLVSALAVVLATKEMVEADLDRGLRRLHRWRCGHRRPDPRG